jgi:hypothetical protein
MRSNVAENRSDLESPMPTVQKSDVQKLDANVALGLVGRSSGTLRRIRQVRETWKVSGWGLKASRERIETNSETAEPDRNDRA